MNKYNYNERVDLVRVLRNGQETRETLPRWLAEEVIGAIPTPDGEQFTERAWIEPLQAPVIDPSAPYPIKASTPARQNEIALKLASFVLARLVA